MPRASASLLNAIIVASACTVGACGGTEADGSGGGDGSSPPPRRCDPDLEVAIDGDPEVEFGFYDDTGDFVAMAERPVYRVFQAVQGGPWAMPFVRIRNMGPVATIDCRLDSDGERLSFNRFVYCFSQQPDGWLQNDGFGMQVLGETFASVNARAPFEAALDCTVTDEDGRSVDFDRTVQVVTSPSR